MLNTFEHFASAENSYHRERARSYFAGAALRRRLRADRRARSQHRNVTHASRPVVGRVA